jgi:hypothetical protein
VFIEVGSNATPHVFGGALAVNDLVMNNTLHQQHLWRRAQCAWVPGNATITDGRFENNQALGTNPEWSNGGGLQAEFGTVSISGTQFIGNSATNGGGLPRSFGRLNQRQVGQQHSQLVWWRRLLLGHSQSSQHPFCQQYCWAIWWRRRGFGCVDLNGCPLSQHGVVWWRFVRALHHHVDQFRIQL